MVLQDGQSELDTAVIQIEGLKKEIRNWDRYSIKSDFLTPTAGFDFTLSTDQPLLFNDILKEGAKVTIAVNDRIQMTGYIDRKTISANRNGGIIYTITGRDILGTVVSASIDPKIKITTNQTVADFVYSVLSEFGIQEIQIGDNVNYNIVTGFLKGQKGQSKTIKVQEATSRKVTADGKSAEIQYQTSSVIQVLNARADLKELKLDQRKVRWGDGAYQTMDRLLARLGLRMWAMADGSGVVVGEPDFTSDSPFKIIRKFNGNNNNVIDGAININAETQPSCIVARGFGGGDQEPKAKSLVIAVNELVAVTPDGNPVKSATNTIARYQGAKVLPIRKELLPKENNIVAVFTQKPVFIKDDESKSIEQLSAFARRVLSRYQKEFITLTYTLKGHSYEGVYPWNFNTMVDVDDDYLDIHEKMWIIGRDFIKSKADGTLTQVRLIKPFTLVLGD